MQLDLLAVVSDPCRTYSYDGKRVAISRLRPMLANPLIVEAALRWVDGAISDGASRDLLAIRQEWAVSETRVVDFIS